MKTIYVRIKFNTLKGKRTTWAKVGKAYFGLKSYIAVDKTGEIKQPQELILIDNVDLIAELPAKLNLKYGELELE